MLEYCDTVAQCQLLTGPFQTLMLQHTKSTQTAVNGVAIKDTDKTIALNINKTPNSRKHHVVKSDFKQWITLSGFLWPLALVGIQCYSFSVRGFCTLLESMMPLLLMMTVLTDWHTGCRNDWASCITACQKRLQEGKLFSTLQRPDHQHRCSSTYFLNRERKCASTIGTVPAPLAGHFQC